MQFDSSILSFLGSVTVRSLVLAALAFLLIRLWRARSAAAQHAVYTVVAAGMLVLAASEPLLPPLPLRILRPRTGAALELPIARIPTPLAAGEPIPLPAAPARRPWVTWPLAIAAAYLAGALAFLIRLAIGYLFTRRLLKAATRIERGWDDAVFESSWISVPLTAGWLHPKILLPAGWDAWDQPKLEAVLAHERTHVRRADWVIAVLAGLNRCIFWFHPLAWWLEKRLAFLAEQACDDEALLLVGSAAPYAQALLDMAAAVRTGQGRLVWEAMAMANVNQVRQRIDRILDETRQIPRGLTRSRWAALIACSLPLIYVASVVKLAPAQTDLPATVSELVRGQRQLSAADVSMMERYLENNAQDLEARGQLIVYYFSIGTREPRMTHTLWLIANHPESSQALLASRGLTPSSSALNDASDFTRVAELWKQQAGAHANDWRVLANAADFFMDPGANFDEAERLLLAAQALQPANLLYPNKIGRLYATAILGTSGDSRFPNSNAGFAARVLSQIEGSNDMWLVHFTGASLAAAAERPVPGHALPPGVLNLDDHPMLVPMTDLGKRLLARGQQLGVPATFSNRTTSTAMISAAPIRGVPGGVVGGVSGGVPGGVVGGVIGGVPGGVQAAPNVPILNSTPHLIHKVDPAYPALAQQARIQGDVKLMVTIGTDGHVQHISVVSGHPLLVPATLEAVKQWAFTPIPAEGTAQISVPFRLDGGDAPVPPPPPPGPGQFMAKKGSLAPGTIRIGAEVQSGKLISKGDPVYPPLARTARVQGNVMLEITIGQDGRVEAVRTLEGHPLLIPAATAAVRQWVYQPTLLNGQPVSVVTTVTVPFQL